MTAMEVARKMGIETGQAEAYLASCDEVIESGQFVAILRGNTVHIAAEIHGLGGRSLLRKCRAILRDWFERHSVLYAPIKKDSEHVIPFAERFGFVRYAVDDTHIWMLQTKEQFYA